MWPYQLTEIYSFGKMGLIWSKSTNISCRFIAALLDNFILFSTKMSRRRSGSVRLPTPEGGGNRHTPPAVLLRRSRRTLDFGEQRLIVLEKKMNASLISLIFYDSLLETEHKTSVTGLRFSRTWLCLTALDSPWRVPQLYFWV